MLVFCNVKKQTKITHTFIDGLSTIIHPSKMGKTGMMESH
jgi:hypothetical protein